MNPDVAELTGYCPRCGQPLIFPVRIDRISSPFESFRGQVAVTADVRVTAAVHTCTKEKK